MIVDKKLKHALIEKLLNFSESMPVYSIANLSDAEIEKRAKYYASRFLGGDSYLSLRFFQKEVGSKLMNLPWDTKMRIYNNSNAVVIEKNLRPLEHLFQKKFDKKQLSEIAINAMKKLELDNWKLSFEQAEFEELLQIKASGIGIDGKEAPVILCRIIGTFRRHINKIPVYGGASIFVKIAEENLIQAVGVDWRQINEKPVSEERIISPSIAAEKIIKNLNLNSPDQVLTIQDYEPVFFALGYYSMPKKYQQNYMQPVYVAMFEPLRLTTFNQFVIILATDHVYESIQTAPETPLSTKRV